MPFEITLAGGAPHAVELMRTANGGNIRIDGRSYRVVLGQDGSVSRLEIDGQAEHIVAAGKGDTMFIHAFGRSFALEVVDPYERVGTGPAQSDIARSPMPGVMIAVHVEPGQAVGTGMQMATIESMKMQTDINAPRDGVVHRVHYSVGETFERNAVLVSLVAEEGEA